MQKPAARQPNRFYTMRWNGRIKPGQTYTHPVISLDIMQATIAAAGTAIDPDRELDGVNLLPYVAGNRTSRPHDTLYWAWGPRKAIRHGDMKAISNDNGRTYMLFDKVKDNWGPQIEGCIDSILIAKDGKLVLEEYFADARPDRPHYQMSITKSIL